MPNLTVKRNAYSMPASLIPRIVSSRDSDDSATPGKMSLSSLLTYKIPKAILEL